jgi:hypothetical protein
MPSGLAGDDRLNNAIDAKNQSSVPLQVIRTPVHTLNIVSPPVPRNDDVRPTAKYRPPNSLGPFCAWPLSTPPTNALELADDTYSRSGGQGLVVGSTFMRVPNSRNHSKISIQPFFPDTSNWVHIRRSPETSGTDDPTVIRKELSSLPSPKQPEPSVDSKPKAPLGRNH